MLSSWLDEVFSRTEPTKGVVSLPHTSTLVWILSSFWLRLPGSSLAAVSFGFSFLLGLDTVVNSRDVSVGSAACKFLHAPQLARSSTNTCTLPDTRRQKRVPKVVLRPFLLHTWPNTWPLSTSRSITSDDVRPRPYFCILRWGCTTTEDAIGHLDQTGYTSNTRRSICHGGGGKAQTTSSTMQIGGSADDGLATNLQSAISFQLILWVDLLVKRTAPPARGGDPADNFATNCSRIVNCWFHPHPASDFCQWCSTPWSQDTLSPLPNSNVSEAVPKDDKGQNTQSHEIWSPNCWSVENMKLTAELMAPSNSTGVSQCLGDVHLHNFKECGDHEEIQWKYCFLPNNQSLIPKTHIDVMKNNPIYRRPGYQNTKTKCAGSASFRRAPDSQKKIRCVHGSRVPKIKKSIKNKPRPISMAGLSPCILVNFQDSLQHWGSRQDLELGLAAYRCLTATGIAPASPGALSGHVICKVALSQRFKAMPTEKEKGHRWRILPITSEPPTTKVIKHIKSSEHASCSQRRDSPTAKKLQKTQLWCIATKCSSSHWAGAQLLRRANTDGKVGLLCTNTNTARGKLELRTYHDMTRQCDDAEQTGPISGANFKDNT